MSTFGDRLREAIETHPMNQSTFSARTGISLQNISHYLAGRRKPGVDVLAQMVKALSQCDVRWLVTGENQ